MLVEEDSYLFQPFAQQRVIMACRRCVVDVGQVFPFRRFVDGITQEAREKPVVGTVDQLDELPFGAAGEERHEGEFAGDDVVLQRTAPDDLLLGDLVE